MKNRTTLSQLKWSYLLIVFFILVIGIAIRVFFDITNQNKILQDDMNSLSEKINRSFEQSVSHAKDKYLLLSYHYMRHDKISKLMKKRDSEALYKTIISDYNRLREIEQYLQSMHFIDTSNRTLVRMHKPELFDDDLTALRPIVMQANKSLENHYGFEVGKNGVSYRITIPYITFENEHIGVLEYGLHPNYFVEEFAKHFEIKSELFVLSSSISKLISKKSYDTFHEYSITNKDKIFDKINKYIDLNNDNQIVAIDDKTYLVINNLNLTDYNNKVVAKIIVAKDITKIIEKNREAVYTNNSINAGLLIIILFFLYIIFSRYSLSLSKLYSNINELNIHTEKLKHIADTDHLTKIYNKRFFNNYLEDFLKNKGKGAIAFFDIDHFKAVNDTYGHLVGDEILIKLADIIEHSIRSDDIFVRWGGEEFVILFLNSEIGTSGSKCEELREKIEKEVFTENISITLSFGVTRIKANDTIEDVLKRADELLYEAKESGRNIVIKG